MTADEMSKVKRERSIAMQKLPNEDLQSCVEIPVKSVSAVAVVVLW